MAKRPNLMIPRLLILSALTLLLSACGERALSDHVVGTAAVTAVTSFTDAGQGSGSLRTVRHDGHLFVVYNGISYGYPGSIIHHPDCPCLKTPEAAHRTPVGQTP